MASAKKPRRKGSTKFSASQILGLIAGQHKPVAWRELAELADAHSPAQITQLRQTVKGLERNDEIDRDHLGAYHVPGTEPVSEAIVRRTGKAFHAGGVVIEDAQRLSLREGDAIEMRVVGESGRVLRVISHADTPVTGILQWKDKHPHVDGLGAYRGRVSLLETPVNGGDGDTVQVRIVDRDRRGLVGIVTDVITADSVLDQAIQTAVSGGHIPDEWPSAVTDAAGRLPKSVQASRFPKREDLTKLPLVTIDGETAKDFDDAVYVEARGGRRGGWRLVVAIADVAHYIKPNSPIDAEAQVRGTSVYFPERVIPMLPETLSNGLCSLRPHEGRLALVCDMQINNQGEVDEYDFYEGVIFSHARLTYEQVQAFVDGGGLKGGAQLDVDATYADGVHDSVSELARLHGAMRKARDTRGALDFATREGQVRLHAGVPVEVGPVARLGAHQMIEEAMIAANVAAARFLEANDQPSLYRVHEPPDPLKIEELRQSLAHVGVRLNPGDVTPGVMQEALSRLPEHADDWLYSQLALRSLKQAVYTPANQGHYGLALERYMHFTSPIRRYPDLMVHRAIKTVVRNRQGSKSSSKSPTIDELHQMGEQCSTYERRAESAAWLVDGWLKCHLLKEQLGETCDGIVAGVTDFGLFVEIEGYFVQGLVHISNLGSDYFAFNARSLSLVGERSGRRFSLGDRLRVTVAAIEPPQGKVDLQLAQNGGTSGGGGQKGTGKGKGKGNSKGKPNNNSNKKPNKKPNNKRSGKRRR